MNIKNFALLVYGTVCAILLVVGVALAFPKPTQPAQECKAPNPSPMRVGDFKVAGGRLFTDADCLITIEATKQQVMLRRDECNKFLNDPSIDFELIGVENHKTWEELRK